MAMSQDEVFSKVQEVLVEALGVDEDEVTPEAKLVEDLGAESIDFLDISFRLEKTFSIKIDQSELFPDDVLSNPDFVQDGKVSERGMQELKAKLPHADMGEFEKSRSVTDFANIFTVNAIVRFVMAKLA